ncbi:HalOD1 output domain-containing protein [Haloarcula amylolytica]|uniref:HalOD1 output domain-containing protein n=1 Tax=Haloarcula amylolytica TaxID=396317 RepID=UPI003C70A294
MDTRNDDTEPEDDSEHEGVYTRFSATDTPSEETVRAIAEFREVEPTALEPLYNSVDPDALDALFAEPCACNENPILTRFTASGCHVVIQNDGTLAILGTESSE